MVRFFLNEAELPSPVGEPLEGQVRVTGLLGTDKLAGHLADPERPQSSDVWGLISPRCDVGLVKALHFLMGHL